MRNNKMVVMLKKKKKNESTLSYYYEAFRNITTSHCNEIDSWTFSPSMWPKQQLTLINYEGNIFLKKPNVNGEVKLSTQWIG